MTARKILIPALILVAAGAVAAWFLMRPGPEPAGRLVLYGNVDIRQVNLAFNVEGRIAGMQVEEGDRVAAGQVVATVESDYYDDAVRLAQARVAAQRAQLARLEAGSRPEEIALARAQVDEARAELVNAQATLGRLTQLTRREVVSEQALDDARAEELTARARLAARQESLNLAVAGPRQEDIEAARAQLRAEEATLDLVQRRRADTTLTAPEAGIILNRVLEPGAIVLPGTTVYTLALITPVWVRTYVAEPDLGRIHPGMAAEVLTDSAPGRVYRGQIGFISPVAEFTPRTVETPDLRTSLVYRLRVIVDSPDQGLRQGMPVTVRLGQ